MLPGLPSEQGHTSIGVVKGRLERLQDTLKVWGCQGVKRYMMFPAGNKKAFTINVEKYVHSMQEDCHRHCFRGLKV